jgi:hypothetical protein
MGCRVYTEERDQVMWFRGWGLLLDLRGKASPHFVLLVFVQMQIILTLDLQNE